MSGQRTSVIQTEVRVKNKFFTQEVCAHTPKLLYAQEACANGGKNMTEQCSGFTCPVEATISLIGGKYKAVILWHLMNNTLRYSELHRKMPKATDKMLAQQLRELEKDGLINRVVYPVVPPKTEYSLTEYGKTLAPILDALCDWGENYLSETQNNKENCQ